MSYKSALFYANVLHPYTSRMLCMCNFSGKRKIDEPVRRLLFNRPAQGQGIPAWDLPQTSSPLFLLYRVEVKTKLPQSQTMCYMQQRWLPQKQVINIIQTHKLVVYILHLNVCSSVIQVLLFSWQDCVIHHPVEEDSPQHSCFFFYT